MSAQPVIFESPSAANLLALTHAATFPGVRVLAWDHDLLYASRGYTLLVADTSSPDFSWCPIARFRPSAWRNLTVSNRLAARLCRDGFHALALLPSGHKIAAVPGAIVTLAPDESEFLISHRILRGTRPLHITPSPDGQVFWGEYFDNSHRDRVHIYVSRDGGNTWEIAYTFPKRAIRHVHNLVYDEWGNCLWILTGDNGSECRILRASLDFKTVDTVLAGTQQTRAVAFVPTKNALYFSSDTPLQQNHLYRMDRAGNVTQLASLNSSSIYGCRVDDAIFFSTMAEPSAVNQTRQVCLYGACFGGNFSKLQTWSKDGWPMKLFQYGNAILPDGLNTSRLLAVTTIAVAKGDQETTLWRL